MSSEAQTVTPREWPASSAGGELGDGRHAFATVCPDDLETLQQEVRRRAAEGLAIYPQGGRTALDYGGIPRRPGVALLTTGLDRVIDYPAADMTITVEAGITLADLQAILAKEGQWLPLDAPFADRATLGGIYATNTSGPRRLETRRPRDLILGVRFVNAAGEVVKGGGRVVKNVAGYDFPRLLTGSMGTLGVLVEMTLKVRPRPEAEAIVWASPSSGSRPSLAEALERLNTSATRPVAVELLNRPAARVIGSGHGLPESDWVLLLGFEGNAASVAWQVDAVMRELPGFESTVVPADQVSRFWAEVTDAQAAGDHPFSLVASLRPSDVVAFLSRLDPALWWVQSHAAGGIVRAHWLGEPVEARIAPILKQLRAAISERPGHLVLARCPTEWKPRLEIWGEPNADVFLMEGIKKALDPAGVFNPGRFVGTI